MDFEKKEKRTQMLSLDPQTLNHSTVIGGVYSTLILNYWNSVMLSAEPSRGQPLKVHLFPGKILLWKAWIIYTG